MKTLKFIILLVIIVLSWDSANAGGTYTLKVGEQRMLSFTPKNGALFNSMSWRSYDTRCVRVDGPQYSSYTYVTALEPTTSSRGALVQCEYKYPIGSIYMTATEDFYITVEEDKPKEPTGIYIPSSLSLVVGDRHTITPTLEPSGATTNVSWSTSDSGIASVTSSGTVIANAPGTAYVTARTYNGYSSQCRVTVAKPTVSLKISKTEALIPKGTKVAITATPSSANIYYTLDGTNPDANSILYSDSILINESLTIKAIGTEDGYNNSRMLTQSYTVTSLKLLETYPENGSLFNRTSLIPCITLNENIYQSDFFDKIVLYCNDVELDGNVIISGNTLYFKPNESLGVGDYSFHIPSNSFKSVYGEYLEDITLSFKIKALHNIKDVETSYGRVMMLSESNRLFLYGTFPEVRTCTGQYQDQYDSPVYVDYNVKSVSSGECHFAIIKGGSSNSSLYVWGRNMSGQLGSGSISIYNNPIPTQVISPVSKAVCGGNYTIFLQFGELYSFGDNDDGQLGLGHFEDRYYYRNKVSNLSNIIDFDCGSGHNVAILSNHDLYSWGYNKYGQLGLGDKENRCTPEKIMENVVSAEASYTGYTLVLQDDGSLWGFGNNNYGQLGLNHTDNVNTPKLIMNDVVKFSAGFSHAMAITSNGDLYGWGSNQYRQIIDSEEFQYLYPTLIMHNIRDVEAGDNCTIAFANDGTMWVWGYNTDFVKKGENILPPTVFSNVNLLNCTSFELSDKTIVLNQEIPLYPVFDNKNYDYRHIIWESSNSEIIQCTEDGFIKGVGNGEAVVTATITNFAGNKVSASCVVTVEAPAVVAVNLDKAEASLKVSEMMQLTATVCPDNAADKTLIWSSSNNNVATVDATGLVTAISVGTTEIRVSANDGLGVSATCKITVEPILIESFSISPKSFTGKEGETFTINVTISPENATNQIIAFSSTNENVANVNNCGTVHIEDVGNAVIKVETTDGSNISTECEVTSLMSEINQILDDDTWRYDVYNISGLLLLKDADKDDLRKLPTGFYLLHHGNDVVKFYSETK